MTDSSSIETPFPDTEVIPTIAPCSFNECLAGHRWPAVLAVARCAGCGGQVLAAQKVNCPFCNEPISRTSLRSDFIPRGAGVVTRCTGAVVPGESLDIELVRHEWSKAEVTTETFLEKEAKEIAADRSVTT